MSKYYYIQNNAVSINPQDLKAGTRIICIKKTALYPILKDGDGPYESINQLKKQSLIFRELLKNNSSRAHKILKKENIIMVKEMIKSSSKQGLELDFISMLQHALSGDIKENQLSGVHFFDKNSMKVKELHQKDAKGVWEGLVEVYDNKTNETYEKVSTFFPKEWTLEKFLSECYFAVNNKIKANNKEHLYDSKTTDDIPVKIIMKKSKLVTIYPIYQQ